MNLLCARSRELCRRRNVRNIRREQSVGERGGTVVAISVVIPMYNEQDEIGSCLDALIDQTRAADEILVVDNNSTDESAAIVAEIATAHPTVRLIHESEPGCHAARAAGYDAASGDVIARTDADTRVDSRWLEAIESFFTSERGDEFAAVGGVATMYDVPPFPMFAERPLPAAAADGIEVSSFSGPNHALRKTAWQAVRDSVTRRQDVWEDLDLSLALTERGKKIFLDPNMKVKTSVRTLRASPIRNLGYITGNVRTVKARGASASTIRAARVNALVRFGSFTWLWLLIRPWDEDTRTWRPHRLLRRPSDLHDDVTKVR
ncbi:glycosyltransferase family 2 protein [Gordonia malaquae]|uniref:glycosyltransferase n=2 Tax=Gordonia malaquae TaxID=410332 RepID=UPI0030FF3DC5